MAKANRGKKKSPEHVAALSASKKGKPNLKLRGRVRPPDVGRKISMAKKGKPNPKLSAALRGRKLSPEHVEKLRKYSATPAAQETRKQVQRLLRTPVDVGEKCILCGRSFTKLVQDHCHRTGRLRGRLCTWCNSGLGFFQDSSVVLRKAAEYLEKYDQAPT